MALQAPNRCLTLFSRGRSGFAELSPPGLLRGGYALSGGCAQYPLFARGFFAARRLGALTWPPHAAVTQHRPNFANLLFDPLPLYLKAFQRRIEK